MRSVCCLVLLLIGAFDARADKPAQEEKSLSLRYLLFLPADYAKEEKKTWPVILFLHGAGETGDKLEMVKRHGPPKIVATKPDFPFIVISPQASQRGWRPYQVLAMLEDVASRYRVDRDRVYLTGLSMGGFGTWATAAVAPDRFAAIVPICGGGNTADAEKLKGMPIWVFHGAQDKVVPPSRSEMMIEAVKKAGGEVKYTLYPDAAHDSWTATYDNPELYKWLLEHKRRGAR